MKYTSHDCRASHTVLLVLSVVVAIVGSPTTRMAIASQHGFPTPELDAFHKVLHPLVHESLPAKDAAAIRKAVPELQERRIAVDETSVAAGAESQRANISKRLAEFDSTMDALRAAAGNAGDDRSVLEALDSVHEAFESLMEALTRKSA